MKISRGRWLNQLKAVVPGVSVRPGIDQCESFVFRGKRVFSFNEEICCSGELLLEGECAVRADSLLSILSRMEGEEVDVTVGEDGLTIIPFAKEGEKEGRKKRKAFVVAESDILLPIDVIKMPKKWRDIPAGFMDAIEITHQCASNDETMERLVCVHVHPDHVEACDNFRVCRFPLRTGVKDYFLLKRESVKHLLGAGMKQMGETEDWVHFKNKSGLVMSIRRYTWKYDDLNHILDVDGEEVVLPDAVSLGVDLAEVFTADDPGKDLIRIDLKEGQMRLRGDGPHGFYEERYEVDFSGDRLSFMIAPKLIREVLNRGNRCVVGGGRLKVSSKKWTYVSSTVSPE